MRESVPMGSAEDRKRNSGRLGRTRRKGEDGNLLGRDMGYIGGNGQGRLGCEELSKKGNDKRRKLMELGTRIQ